MNDERLQLRIPKEKDGDEGTNNERRSGDSMIITMNEEDNFGGFVT